MDCEDIIRNSSQNPVEEAFVKKGYQSFLRAEADKMPVFEGRIIFWFCFLGFGFHPLNEFQTAFLSAANKAHVKGCQTAAWTVACFCAQLFG